MTDEGTTPDFSRRMTRVVPELKPNTRYTLRLRAVSKFNVASDWSEAIDFTTPGTNYQPPLPRPLLYEGNTSTEVTSGESALAEFTDGDLKAWPKANIVTTDNIHFSAPFYAPGSLRLDWQWFDDVGSATIELREKESLTIVDKWELPTAPSGGTTFPMHYSSAYEWRLNVGGPAGATGPTNDDARIAVGDRGIYEQVPTNEIVFGRLYDEVDPTFRYETWEPRIASLGNNKFVSIGVMDQDADPSRGLVVEEWTRDGNYVTKDRQTLLTGGGTNETGLGDVAGVHAFDDKFVLWVGKGYSEESFGGDYGIMATLIELTDAGAVVRDRATVDIWSFSATNYDYALTSGLNPSDGALLAYMKQTNNGWDIAIHTVRIGRSGNSLTLSHRNVPLEQTDYPDNPAIAPISDTSYMVTYITLDQAPPTPDGPRLRGFVIDETLATPGVSVGPTMITALPHHLALSRDGLAYVNRLARHVGGESFTAAYSTSERPGTTGRQYALNVITIDANLGLIRTEDVGWPSAGGSDQSYVGVWHVPGYDHVVAIALDAQNTSWRLLEIKDTGIIQLDEPMLETTSHDPNYWNIDFVPFDTVGVVALSTSVTGLEWDDRPFILEFPAVPITSIFSARVRLQGSETALWDLIFAPGAEPAIETCWPINGSKYLTLDEYPQALHSDRLASDDPADYFRQPWEPGPQSNSVHWFDDCHFVVFLHSAEGNEPEGGGSPPEYVVFEWWSIDENAIPLLEGYEVIDHAEMSLQFAGFGEYISSQFVQTSDPDTVFMAAISNRAPVNDDVINASLAEGFFVTRDQEVIRAGSIHLYNQKAQDAINSIVDTSDGNNTDIGALWLLETEYPDMFVGMFSAAWYFHSGGRRDRDQIHRTIFSINVDIDAKTFSLADTEVFNDFDTMDPNPDGSTLLLRGEVIDAHCLAVKEGRVALISWNDAYHYSVGSTSAHYLDMIDYDGAGNFSGRFREKDDYLWREIYSERPEVHMYTFGVGGYGMPHAVADRSRDLANGKMLMTTDHWIEYNEAAFWYEDGGAWFSSRTTDGGNGTPVGPAPTVVKFGSPHPDPGRRVHYNILAHLVVDFTNRTMRWAGWPGVKEMPTISGVYEEGDSFVTEVPKNEMQFGQNWDTIIRYTKDGRAVYSQMPWMFWDKDPLVDEISGDIVSPGWDWGMTFGPYIFGEFDISNLHEDNVYIKGFDKEYYWWPSWEPSGQFVPAASDDPNYPGPANNADRLRPYWQHMLTISPSGKLWWSYMEAEDYNGGGVSYRDLWLAAIVDFDEEIS